ncbi:hypothetical protein CapIbe_022294 [Capra ibex]
MDSRVEAAETPARVPWILSPPVIQSRDPFLPPDPPKELSPTPGPKAQRHRLAEHTPLLLQKSLTERAQKTHLEGPNHPGGKTCLLMTSFQSPVGALAPRQPEEEPRGALGSQRWSSRGGNQACRLWRLSPSLLGPAASLPGDSVARPWRGPWGGFHSQEGPTENWGCFHSVSGGPLLPAYPSEKSSRSDHCGGPRQTGLRSMDTPFTTSSINPTKKADGPISQRRKLSQGEIKGLRVLQEAKR